eukprot:m.41249 g.41249  ORF g.41249 m.41249 type:complete len:435 (+) comp10408_c0_seq1:74-1378(+)
MGSVLGTIGSAIASAACCLGSCMCNRCCSGSGGPCKSSTLTRVAYALILLVSAITAWVLLDPKVEHALQKMQKYVGSAGCEDGTDCSNWGELGVYRVMSAVGVFHFVLMLLMIGVKSSRDPRSSIQNGWWSIKLLFLTGLSVGAFFIDNSFFFGIGWFGLVCGFIFILIQMVLLVDFAYKVGDSWVSQAEEGSGCHKFLLFGVSFSLYILSFAVTICCYVFYAKADGETCGLSKAIISVNLVMSVIMTLCSLSTRVQEAQPSVGLLQASVITFYTTYLTWSAVSNVDGTCSQGVNGSATTRVVGSLLTFAAVAYSSLRTSHSSQLGRLGMGENSSEEQVMLLDSGDDVESGKTNEEDGVKYSWSFFHLTFMLAAFYLMMLITDWANIKDGHNADNHVGSGMASVWVQVVSSWIAALLYIWTLVAPICLPNRDFS